MAETLEKNLDNMEEVAEGSNAVTKNAKPAEKSTPQRVAVLKLFM